MRRLMLLRHAKSDWSVAGARDHDRALNARGREAAPKMGDYMARHALVPDLIIASTARRVSETLDLVLPAFEVPPPMQQDARVYGAGANALLGVIRETSRAAHSLLLERCALLLELGLLGAQLLGLGRELAFLGRELSSLLLQRLELGLRLCLLVLQLRQPRLELLRARGLELLVW